MQMSECDILSVKREKYDSTIPFDEYGWQILGYLVNVALPQLQATNAPQEEIDLMQFWFSNAKTDLDVLYRALFKSGLRSLSSRMLLNYILRAEHENVLRLRIKSWKEIEKQGHNTLHIPTNERCRHIFHYDEGKTGVIIRYPAVAIIYGTVDVGLPLNNIAEHLLGGCTKIHSELSYSAEILNYFPGKEIFRKIRHFFTLWYAPRRMEVVHFVSSLHLATQLCLQSGETHDIVLLVTVVTNLPHWCRELPSIEAHYCIREIYCAIRKILSCELALERILDPIQERTTPLICDLLFALAQSGSLVSQRIWSTEIRENENLGLVLCLICRLMISAMQNFREWSSMLSLEKDVLCIEATIQELLDQNVLSSRRNIEFSQILSLLQRTQQRNTDTNL